MLYNGSEVFGGKFTTKENEEICEEYKRRAIVKRENEKKNPASILFYFK